MRRTISTMVAVVLVATALAVTAAGQETVNFASVSGRVTDPQGGVIRGATVTARHTETNVTATTTTDEEGRFRFAYLRIGPYEIAARQPGFADVARALTLSIGAAYELPLAMSVGEVSASLTVTGQAPVLEMARSQIAGTLPQVEVQNLPMNGRNFLDLALLVPGVSPTNIGSTQLFAETSAVPGQGISIGSQRNLSNNFIVDGLSANDDAAGLSGIPYGVDAVEQFQVVTSGGQAELGRALGGYINVVTKSGTNTLRGTIYGFFRDDAFNAANALSGRKLPMDQQQYGGSVGGADRRQSHVLLHELRTAAARSDRPDHHPRRRTYRSSTPDWRRRGIRARRSPRASIRTRYTAQTCSAKIDHQISGSDQLSVRYALYDVTSDNSRGAGALNAPTRIVGAGQHRSDHRRRQHLDALVEDGQRNPRAVRVRRPRGSTDATRSVRPSASPASHPSARPRAARPGASTRCTRSSTTSRIRPARTRCAPAWTSSSTTTPSPILARPAAAMRSRRCRIS